MLWVKRLLPIVLILLVGFGYKAWNLRETNREKAVTRHWAELTTTIWEASARFHNSADSFLAFRDSVLAAESLTVADVQAYLKENRDKPEEYLDYARQVSFLMDSLEQQRLKKASLDTLKVDSTAAESLTRRP